MVVQPIADAPESAPAPPDLYGEARKALEDDRVEMAAKERTPELQQQARERLTAAIRHELIPHWYGTAWEFYGTTQVPGEGAIACGYFVSTVLEHASLQVERVMMAQQRSEYIVLTFSEPPHVRRFRTGDVDAVVDALEQERPGVYVVGLDFHTGFVIRTADTVEFCHSNWIESEGVVCNDPRTDPAFASEYHIYGPVFEDAVIDKWLGGEPVTTYVRDR